MCKHQQRFGLDVQCSALVLNFNNIFSNGHLYRAGQSMNSLPSQILERYAQCYQDNQLTETIKSRDWQMCLAVYISTDKELETGTFVAGQTYIYFEKPTVEEAKALRPKFSKKNIYYVGSSSGCSCDFGFDSEDFYATELISEEDKKSPQKLIEFLTEMTLSENIEFYCCWEGDWNLPVESKREIDIRNISLENNYFGPKEREFINFTKQN